MSCIYNPEDLSHVLQNLTCIKKSVKTINKDKIYYQNVVITFGVYTSDITYQSKEIAIMHSFGFCINGNVIIGRTQEQLFTMLKKLVEHFNTNLSNRLAIYMANEAFEFQFLHRHTQWSELFAISEREPLIATTCAGIEFRCTKSLAGASIYELHELTPECNVKVKHSISNRQMHSRTDLEETDIAFIYESLKLQNQFVSYRMKEDRGIAHIKITSTKYVRDAMRNKALYCKDKKEAYKYRKLMQKLTLTVEEYDMAKKCFRGAYCGMNEKYRGVIVENVKSRDFTSKYPSDMCYELFPMSKGKKIEIESVGHLMHLRDEFLMMFNIEFRNLRQKESVCGTYLKAEDCKSSIAMETTNGYVTSANVLKYNCTNVDLDAIEMSYTYDEIFITNCYVYEAAYLPKPVIAFILQLYAEKADTDKESVMYRIRKSRLNSCYGIMVMSILFDRYEYIPIVNPSEYKDGMNPWHTVEADVEKEIEKYNSNVRRFTSYIWGVFVTAYSRRSLFTAIAAMGNDYVYADADDVKYTGEHEDFFEAYNEYVKDRLRAMTTYYDIPELLLCPNGKWLGTWHDSGDYTKFKAVATKVYIAEEAGEISITAAGLPKKACEWFIENNDDVFEAFDYGMKIDREHTNIYHVDYVDKAISGKVTDYLGNEEKFSELSYVTKKQSAYSLNVTDDRAIILDKIFRKETKYYG